MLDQVLRHVSDWFSMAICVAAGLHFLLYLYLMAWSRRDLRRMVADVDRYTRGLKHRSVLEPYSGLSDQMDAFLADIRDVLNEPPGSPDRKTLLERLKTLDESRRYLQSQGFETLYNMARTMIEAYPLAGVLGTIIAIGAALRTGVGDQSGRQTVQAIVEFFGNSIWSTFAGLLAAILLMFLNSLVEPRFQRLSENRTAVRETIHRAKRELITAEAAG